MTAELSQSTSTLDDLADEVQASIAWHEARGEAICASCRDLMALLEMFAAECPPVAAGAASDAGGPG